MSELDLAIEQLNRHKLPGIVQIPAEMIKAGVKIIRYEIHKHIISFCNKEELPEEWKDSIIVPIYNQRDNTDCSKQRGISHLPTKKKKLYPTTAVKVNCIWSGNYLGNIDVDFDATGLLLEE